jgi:precorrin-6B methylase 2
MMTVLSESGSENKVSTVLKWLIGIERYIYLKNYKIGLFFGRVTDLLEIKEVIIDDEYFTSKDKRRLQIIVDVGAGIGDFSIMMAKKFPRATVFAIDSDKTRYEILEKNIRLNSLTNVIPLFRHIKNISEISNLSKSMIDLVKFDCEGCEFPIILSAKRGQLKNIMKIVMEYHLSQDRNLLQMTRSLKEQGFTVRTRPSTVVKNLGHISANRIN